MEKTKSGFAAMIGRPNTGKSTLMNHLIGQKIAITSDRPQTTRNRIQTVYTDERGQIIFVDTPGFLRKSHNRLGEYMMDVSVGTLADADVVLEQCEEQEIAVLPFDAPEFPERLRRIAVPPAVLYVKGSLPPLDLLPVISVIGTRKASPYGIKMGGELAARLAADGAVVGYDGLENAAVVVGAMLVLGREYDVARLIADEVFVVRRNQEIFSFAETSGAAIVRQIKFPALLL